MIFANLDRKTKLLRTTTLIKNQRFEKQIDLNPRITPNKSNQALKKFNQIYTQISGKQIVVQSIKENHNETSYSRSFSLWKSLMLFTLRSVF